MNQLMWANSGSANKQLLLGLNKIQIRRFRRVSRDSYKIPKNPILWK